MAGGQIPSLSYHARADFLSHGDGRAQLGQKPSAKIDEMFLPLIN